MDMFTVLSHTVWVKIRHTCSESSDFSIYSDPLNFNPKSSSWTETLVQTPDNSDLKITLYYMVLEFAPCRKH